LKTPIAREEARSQEEKYEITYGQRRSRHHLLSEKAVIIREGTMVNGGRTKVSCRKEEVNVERRKCARRIARERRKRRRRRKWSSERGGETKMKGSR
jgi:hypothetical protein